MKTTSTSSDHKNFSTMTLTWWIFVAHFIKTRPLSKKTLWRTKQMLMDGKQTDGRTDDRKTRCLRRLFLQRHKSVWKKTDNLRDWQRETSEQRGCSWQLWAGPCQTPFEVAATTRHWQQSQSPQLDTSPSSHTCTELHACHNNSFILSHNSMLLRNSYSSTELDFCYENNTPNNVL